MINKEDFILVNRFKDFEMISFHEEIFIETETEYYGNIEPE